LLTFYTLDNQRAHIGQSILVSDDIENDGDQTHRYISKDCTYSLGKWFFDKHFVDKVTK